MALSCSYRDEVLLDGNSKPGLHRNTRTSCDGEEACTWCNATVEDMFIVKSYLVGDVMPPIQPVSSEHDVRRVPPIDTNNI